MAAIDLRKRGSRQAQACPLAEMKAVFLHFSLDFIREPPYI
jgi:hypothetical protein